MLKYFSSPIKTNNTASGDECPILLTKSTVEIFFEENCEELLLALNNWALTILKFGAGYNLFQGCHLSSTLKFPEFSLTFYSFPIPLTDQNEIIFACYHNDANCITSKLGVTLKGKKFAPQREQILSE